jgi:hypothetical protein
MTILLGDIVPVSCLNNRDGSGTIAIRHDESRTDAGFYPFVPIVPEISAGIKKPAEMLGRNRAYRAYYYVVVEVRHDSGRILLPSVQRSPARPLHRLRAVS